MFTLVRGENLMEDRSVLVKFTSEILLDASVDLGSGTFQLLIAGTIYLSLTSDQRMHASTG